MTERTADHAGVADDQQVLARVTPDQVVEYRSDTRTEGVERFRPCGTALHRIGVKSIVFGTSLALEFLTVAALPGAKSHLAQVADNLDRQVARLTQPLGERMAALQRRADDALPATGGGGGIAHLLPAPGGQRIINAVAAEAVSAYGFTVAQVVESSEGHCRSLSSEDVVVLLE